MEKKWSRFPVASLRQYRELRTNDKFNSSPSSSSILYIDMDRGDSESVYSFLESYYRCQVYYIWSSENFTLDFLM